MLLQEIQARTSVLRIDSPVPATPDLPLLEATTDQKTRIIFMDHTQDQPVEVGSRCITKKNSIKEENILERVNRSWIKLIETKSRFEGNELIYTEVFQNNVHNVFEYVYRCTGDFQNGMLNGTGKKCIHEDVYEGQFLNNKLHGQGKKSLWNIWVYEGRFENDMLNGQGRLNVRNGDEIYEGHFENDRLNGKGKITCYDGHFGKEILKTTN